MRARDLALGLLGVVVLAASMRVLPLASFAVWGSDTAEYYHLSRVLLQEGYLPLEYDGWGIAYPWFPGVYILASGLSAMTGLDVRFTLEAVVPALAGLTALGVALLSYHLFRRGDAAVLAGASVAVFMPHVLATSHAIPGDPGHLFVLGALLLTLRAEAHRALLAALVLVVAALVVTHHLSTYMLLLALGGILLARIVLVAKPAPRGHRATWFALAFTLLAALAYWGWAPPIRDEIVPSQSDVGLFGFGAAAVAGLAVLAMLPALRRRWAWRHRPKPLGDAEGLRTVGLMFLVVFVSFAVLGLVGIPGTSVTITLDALPWILPLAALAAFAFLGTKRSKFRPRMAEAYGWTLAIFGSLAVMAAAQSVVLLPYRHAEYLLEPIAIYTGAGLAVAVAYAARRGLQKQAILGVALLLLANAAIAYPPPAVLAGFQEGTTHAEFEAVLWARDHVRLGPDAVIAADHRLSSVLFGYGGLNASWEYAPNTFHAATFEEARGEMEAVRSPTGMKRVDYVFLSQSMREGLALLQWEPARPLAPAAQAKFEGPPFVPLCRNEEVVIYQVAWLPDVPAPAPTPVCRPS